MGSFNIEQVAGEMISDLAGRQIYFTTSWDDGVTDDIRLAEIAEQNNIPVILFVCPRYPNRGTLSPSQLTQLGLTCEIGSHTMDHQPIDNCSAEEAINQVVSGRKYLEDIMGREVNHFCLVGGRYNKKNLEAIAPTVDSIRTTGVFSFQRPENKHFIVPSLQIRFTGRTHPAKVVFEAFKKLRFSALSKVAIQTSRGARQHDFIGMVPELTQNSDIYLHLWGHSWDVAEQHAWSELEAIFSLLKTVGAKPLAYSEFIEQRRK